MVRADGTHIIVQVGADFAVTAVQETPVAPAAPGGGKGRGAGGQPPAGGTAGGQTPSASGPATIRLTPLPPSAAGRRVLSSPVGGRARSRPRRVSHTTPQTRPGYVAWGTGAAGADGADVPDEAQ